MKKKIYSSTFPIMLCFSGVEKRLAHSAECNIDPGLGASLVSALNNSVTLDNKFPLFGQSRDEPVRQDDPSGYKPVGL